MRHLAVCEEHLNRHFLSIVGRAQKDTDDAYSNARKNYCDEIAVKWILVKTRSSSSILQGAVLLQREPVYCGSKLSATLTRGPARLTTTCQVHSFQTLGFISVIRGYFKVTAPLSMDFEFT
jgi:hypothetical protein